jgi:rubrerythrin
MKVASHLRTQAALKKSHESAMAELMLSHRSKVDKLTSTHAFNLNVEKNNLRQRISSERKLQNALYNVVLDSRQIKQDACKSVWST